MQNKTIPFFKFLDSSFRDSYNKKKELIAYDRL